MHVCVSSVPCVVKRENSFGFTDFTEFTPEDSRRCFSLQACFAAVAAVSIPVPCTDTAPAALNEVLAPYDSMMIEYGAGRPRHQ